MPRFERVRFGAGPFCKSLESFANGGTEALLCRLNKSDNFEVMLVPAFRGIQPLGADVVTDIERICFRRRGRDRSRRGFPDAYR